MQNNVDRRVRLGLREEGKKPKDFIETITGIDKTLDKLNTTTQSDLVADLYYKLPKKAQVNIVNDYIEYFWASKDKYYDMLDDGYGYEVLMSSGEPAEMIIKFICDRVDDNPLA